MRQFLWLLAALGVLLLGGSTEQAWAQRPQTIGGTYAGTSDNPVGPTVSPYLNLLTRNQQGIVPYQTLVKPLIDQRNAIQRQGAALSQLQQQVYTAGPGGATGTPGATGHATFFMNYSHFYSVRR
jgi:hypothetical protein